MATKITLGNHIRVPQTIRDWAESHKENEGVWRTEYQGKPVYLIAAGMRPTGGFQVVVEPSLREIDTVIYRIAGPSPDDFVIQIITYPYELVFSEKPLRFFREDGATKTEIMPQP